MRAIPVNTCLQKKKEFTKYRSPRHHCVRCHVKNCCSKYIHTQFCY